MSSLSKKLRYKIRNALLLCGIDVYPSDHRNSVQAFLQHLFVNKGVTSVWDVGANTGQYAEMLRNIGFKGSILSFEPIPEAWAVIKEKATGDAGWRIWERLAIASASGSAELMITSDSVSSSLLSPLDTNKVIHSINVETATLASVVEKARPAGVTLLKLDCQGSEYEILESAASKISVFEYVQIEASIYPFYDGEKNVWQITELMSQKGYDVAFVFPGVADSKERMAQIEMFFKRN